MRPKTKRMGGASVGWLRRGGVGVLACAAALAALIAVPMTGSANNDPHRIFNPPSSGTLSGLCSFPIYYSQTSKEYSTVTTEPDGSTVVKTEGSLRVTYTNEKTGTSITVNNSGPGTAVFPPSGTVVSFEYEGLSGLGGYNLTTFGFPSDLVVTSGLFQFTYDYTTQLVVSVTRMPHVVLDICAALS